MHRRIDKLSLELQQAVQHCLFQPHQVHLKSTLWQNSKFICQKFLTNPWYTRLSLIGTLKQFIFNNWNRFPGGMETNIAKECNGKDRQSMPNFKIFEVISTEIKVMIYDLQWQSLSWRHLGPKWQVSNHFCPNGLIWKVSHFQLWSIEQNLLQWITVRHWLQQGLSYDHSLSKLNREKLRYWFISLKV